MHLHNPAQSPNWENTKYIINAKRFFIHEQAGRDIWIDKVGADVKEVSKGGDEETQAVTTIAGRRAENTEDAKTFVRARWVASSLDVLFVIGHGYVCGLEKSISVHKKTCAGERIEEGYAHQPTPSRTGSSRPGRRVLPEEQGRVQQRIRE